MPATTQQHFRKFCDIWGSMERSRPVHDALIAFLQAHEFPYEMESHEDDYGRFFWRYKVKSCDWRAAMAVMPAIREIQARCQRQPRSPEAA